MIELERSIYDGMIDHARAVAPKEACGILAGHVEEDRARVTSRHPTENVAEQPRAEYLIDPEQQLALFERIEAAGKSIVGFYHSHPRGPTAPSETDREHAAWPGKSYVIVAMDGEPFVGSWRWRATAERFEAEPVQVD